MKAPSKKASGRKAPGKKVPIWGKAPKHFFMNTPLPQSFKCGSIQKKLWGSLGPWCEHVVIKTI